MTRRIFTPSAPQQVAIPFLFETPRCALWASMGIGKSSAVATLIASQINYFAESRPTIIVGPLRVARDTWPNEFKKWEHLSNIPVSVMVGSAEERKRALRRDAAVYTINYDNLPWLMDQLDGEWPFVRIVADESTRLKKFRPKGGGLYAGALGRVAHSSDYFIELTGKPAPNGLKDLWGQAWFLDAGVRLGRTYGAFETRWFGYRRIKDALNPNKTQIQTVIFPGSDEQIHDRLRDICLTLDAKDYFQLNKPLINTVWVDLPPRARQQYKEMEREMFIALESGEDVEAFTAAGKSMKCLQVANGAVYLDPEKHGEGQWRVLHDEKLDALDSIISEASGAPLLVAIQFKSDRARILERFKGNAADISTPAGMEAFSTGQVQLGIAHPGSMGHGIDGLQEFCWQVVFFGWWWDLDPHDQIIERVGPMRQLQAGFADLRNMTIHHILARDTIDEDVCARHVTKRSVQDLLLDRMKRKAP